MKVGIIGGSGMLGTELMKMFPGSINIPHKFLDVKDLSFCPIPFWQFGLLINTAAFHDVAECEKFPNESFAVNYIGARNLARICRIYNIRLIHISTNMVFNGRKDTAYTTDDLCDPLNIYGYSKWLGECAIKDEVAKGGLKATIVRLGPIYGHAPCRGKNGRQFVSSLLAKAATGAPLSYPCDQIVNPISCADAAAAIRNLMDEKVEGVAHVGSKDNCSWYQFAGEILAQSGSQFTSLEAITTTDPKRPLMGALQPSLKTPSWQESLAGYFSNTGQ
jgi:dTDP-4-dehydrorhamnose reductase